MTTPTAPTTVRATTDWRPEPLDPKRPEDERVLLLDAERHLHQLRVREHADDRELVPAG